MLHEPTLKEIDEVRKHGLRPVVVACFVFEKKILMVYDSEHDVWQLPQGGIENKETFFQALVREMKEELGETFMKQGMKSFQFLGDDTVVFPQDRHGLRGLFTDDGEPMIMVGKHYFFIAVTVRDKTISLDETDFDDLSWLGYHEAMALLDKIYQPGKKRITRAALEALRTHDDID